MGEKEEREKQEEGRGRGRGKVEVAEPINVHVRQTLTTIYCDNIMTNEIYMFKGFLCMHNRIVV